jgi:hypothetical protein
MLTLRTLTLAGCAGLFTACGSKAADTPTPDSGAPVAASAAQPAVVTITAKDFSYEAPDTISAGMVTLRLVNQGPELHHVQLLKLDDGHTIAELEAGLKAAPPGSPPPPWVHDVAGPNSPIPSGEQSLTQEMAPGNYVIICFIPSADHVPHAMKGMLRPLTVVPATGPMAAAPTADITVRMTDYAWAVTPAITKGKHMIRIENDAEQSHEMFIAQLAPGKTVAEMAIWAENQNGPPPGKPIGGISGMPKGAVAYVPVDLEPGEYGLFCFIPDAKDGKPHVAHGMLTSFTVN